MLSENHKIESGLILSCDVIAWWTSAIIQVQIIVKNVLARGTYQPAMITNKEGFRFCS